MIFLPVLLLWEFYFASDSFAEGLIVTSEFTITFLSFKTKCVTGVFGTNCDPKHELFM